VTKLRDLAAAGKIQKGDFADVITLLRSGAEIPDVVRITIADLLDEKSDSYFVLRPVKKSRGTAPSAINKKFVFVNAIVMARISQGMKKEAAIAEACKKCGVSRATAFNMLKRWDDMMRGYELWEQDRSLAKDTN
jgi:hypothetical protein